ncbi:MAG: hypothetical protein IJB59_09480 [Oscillospiraceae bacterium]|nr:hypothetical protein [Oscillospiraceae bacterium]
MDMNDIKKTDIWQLYEKGRNYCRKQRMYIDTDRNHRFYNGNQWEGAKLGGVEPVQKNFIKPVVKYKVSVIHDNLYAIVFSSQNHEDSAFQQTAGKICDMLNRYAARVWEQDKMDYKGRRITKDAAINDEGVLYVDFDNDRKMPVNEIVDKNDIYFGNENSDDIQSQPYILIRRRMPVVKAREFAKSKGAGDDKLMMIVGDMDTFEESGDAAKEEVDPQVTVVYKLYKDKGVVHYSCATMWCQIVKDANLGIPVYPVAHYVWEEKKGSARGEGEVRNLIPNQIEVNKTEMRRILTVKTQAYPHKVVDTDKVENVDQLNQVGGIIRTKGQTVDDVHKVVGTLPPAQMSPDVKQLQDDLIQVTRDLAGAGDIATGQVNPETASGRAILAVQQASQAPMTEQKESYKAFIEDVARIWLEYLIVHSVEGVDMEYTVTDPQTGEEQIKLEKVPQSALQALKASIKVDVTPKSVYDRFAQEQTIENMLTQGFFNAQRVSELEIYYKVLPDDAVAPKQLIGEAIKYIKGEQRRIADLQTQAQKLMQESEMKMNAPLPGMEGMGAMMGGGMPQGAGLPQ